MRLQSPIRDRKWRILLVVSRMFSQRQAQLVLRGLALCLFLLAYLHIVQIQDRAKNAEIGGDQIAYLNFAKEAYYFNFHYTGGRNQMPLYPWIQALFYSPELTDEAFFEQAKRINVALSILVIAALGLAFFAKFSLPYAAWSILCIACLVYAIKSPYVLVENLYYGLFAFAYFLSLEALFAPKWYKTISCGALFALAHFAKASAFPALLLFACSYVVQFVIRIVRRELTLECARDLILRALFPILVFLVLLSPYFLESKARYGSYFYNVNTTFYMWYDSWGEVLEGTRAYGDRAGYPDMPPQEIPSLQKYLDDHGVGPMIIRLFDGSKLILKLACSGEKSRYAYGYCSQISLGILAIAMSLPILLRSKPWRHHLDHAHVVWYVSLLLVVYAIATAWYMPIVGNSGVRIILNLFIPLLWTVGLVIHTPRVSLFQFKLLEIQVHAHSIFFFLLSVSLIYEIYMVIETRASIMSGEY